MKKFSLIGLCVIALLLLAGCTAGPNNVAAILEIIKEPAGFWFGIWHGTIAPITFVDFAFQRQHRHVRGL